MSVAGPHFTWTIAAGEDLDDLTAGTGHLYKAVSLDDGMISQNGREAGGLLLYGGRQNEHITLGYAGVMKFTAGAPVNAGRRLTVNGSGYLIEASSGGYVVGRCLDTAVVSGGIGTGAFNFATIAYMGQSGETA
ncbi:MAG: hypothetical protein OEZ59_02835 [Deltaproteobacteria bacterium]|nr:hypothetical protein [Deltaproteobacteria bacterium]